ncbi:hypothetical protein HK098_001541 [Nowakowskiella sp. JEL0407]|nr:hypothetical protein HK098_001541 [Nowakowskiella sp. JEL0407]
MSDRFEEFDLFNAVVISNEEMEANGRFVKISRITYSDPRVLRLASVLKGQHEQSLSMANTTIFFKGVAILPIIKTGTETEIVLITEFRATTGKVILGLPAGLLDKNETPEIAALRELKEETGYIGTLISVSPIIYNDSWMSSANMHLVVVEVDASLPQNQNPIPKPDAGEFIVLHTVNVRNLREFMIEFEAKGGSFTSDLEHLVCGIEIGGMMRARG